jgi:hypothetical protein
MRMPVHRNPQAQKRKKPSDGDTGGQQKAARNTLLVTPVRSPANQDML